MEKETKKKSKVLDILETIFYVLLLVGIVVLIFIFFGLKGIVIAGGSVLAFYIIGTIICKIDEKKEREYRDNYITEKIIEDNIFGQMKFEKDSLKNRLICADFKISFGEYKPVIEIVDYEEKDKEIYFRSLEYLYSKHEEIAESLLEEFLDAYGNVSKEKSKEKITYEILKKNFGIERICMGKIDIDYPEKLVIMVEGNPNKNKLFTNYYINPTAYMDCETREIYYSLED